MNQTFDVGTFLRSGPPGEPWHTLAVRWRWGRCIPTCTYKNNQTYIYIPCIYIIDYIYTYFWYYVPKRTKDFTLSLWIWSCKSETWTTNDQEKNGNAPLVIAGQRFDLKVVGRNWLCFPWWSKCQLKSPGKKYKQLVSSYIIYMSDL